MVPNCVFWVAPLEGSAQKLDRTAPGPAWVGLFEPDAVNAHPQGADDAHFEQLGGHTTLFLNGNPRVRWEVWEGD